MVSMTIVKTPVIIEGFILGLLEAHGRDPQRFFYTGKKIEELRDKIDPPEVGRPIWELLSDAACKAGEADGGRRGVRGPQPHSCARKDADSVELAAVEQHLTEPQIIGGRRHQS